MTFESLLLRCLGSASRLEQYIDGNVDLAEYVKARHPFYVELARTFASPNMVQEARLTDHQKVLEILRWRRPDLYNVLISRKNGLGWLKAQNFSGLLG